MKFVGVDHGTLAIRFSDGRRCFEIERRRAARMSERSILHAIEKFLSTGLDEISLIALSYGMGDAINKIVDIRKVRGRGVKGAAGRVVGGGTRVFDAIRRSGIPAVLIPGIHRGMEMHPAMKFYSHIASGEKVGLCYYIHLRGERNFIVSDVSSTTVTLVVDGGKIVGGVDACCLAPGVLMGPLDLQAIRDIDAGRKSAMLAFSEGGILKLFGKRDFSKLSRTEQSHALEILSALVAMEISSLKIFTKNPSIFLAGGMGRKIKRRVEKFLHMNVGVVDKWAAARGCAFIARDVFLGSKKILGIEVDYDRDKDPR